MFVIFLTFSCVCVVFVCVCVCMRVCVPVCMRQYGMCACTYLWLSVCVCVYVGYSNSSFVEWSLQLHSTMMNDVVRSAGHVPGCPHFILLSLSLKPILTTLLCLCLSLTWVLSPSHQSLLLLPCRHGNLPLSRPTPILVCHYYCTIAVSHASRRLLASCHTCV